MKTSIKEELKSHILSVINDGILTNENKDEWHFYAFNETEYMIGYHACSQWLKKHGLGELEAAAICTEYEIEHFGKSTVYENSESVVNMLAYIYGDDILNEIDAENIGELKLTLLNKNGYKYAIIDKRCDEDNYICGIETPQEPLVEHWCDAQLYRTLEEAKRQIENANWSDWAEIVEVTPEML